jgi:hypothetical protein
MSDLIGHCPTCKTSIRRGHPYAWCSECGKPLPVEMQAELNLVRTPAPAEPPPRLVGPEVTFRIFSSSTRSWQELFGEAAAFASRLGRGRLINISHSEDDNEGVVTVWYWTA